MATGKQLSFMCGEVSPALLFNSSEVSYATGLKRLKNAYVLKEGGVANRPGFLKLFWNPQINSDETRISELNYNFEVLPQGKGPNISAFTFWNSVDLRWDILEFGYLNDLTPTQLVYQYNFHTGGSFALLDISFFPTGTKVQDTIMPPLNDLRFVVAGDQVIMFPHVWLKVTDTEDPDAYVRYPVNIAFDLNTKTWKPYGVLSTERVSEYGTSGNSNGTAPFLPVSYLFTLERADGYEYLVGELSTQVADITTWNPANPPGFGPLMPHAQQSSMNKTDLLDSFGSLKGGEIFRVYRGTWASTWDKQFYKLATMATVDATSLEVSWQDFGESDPSQTPPIERDSVILIQQGNLGAYFGEVGESLGQAAFGAFHQQRLHVYCERVAAEDNAVVARDAMDIFLASKLNTPKQFTQPIVFSYFQSFSYDFSSMRNARKVAMLSMDRLIIFTSTGAHIVQGGLNGTISPTELNPVQISGVGCHHKVEPKMAGNKGYYLSADSSRLMGIFWNDEGQYKVFEASTFSSHLLEGEEFVRMEVLSNKEDSVFLLTSMGKLIHITFNGDNPPGFATFELKGGYIENIFPLKTKQMMPANSISFEDSGLLLDVLGAYVIRNGKRSLEMLVPREDVDPAAFMFMDSAESFGTFLTKQGDKYLRATYPLRLDESGDPIIDIQSLPNQDMAIQYNLNIGDTDTLDWGPGEDIWLYSSGELPVSIVNPFDRDYFRFDFYYDKGGIIHTLRGQMVSEQEELAVPVGDFTHRIKLVFDSEVPEELRDVYSQNISGGEKGLLYTRYAISTKKLWGAGAHIYSQLHKTFGEEIPVNLYADKWAMSSQLNPDYAGKNVVLKVDPFFESVYIELEDDFVAGGFVGLPYEMEIQTLPVEASDNRTFTSGRTILTVAGLGLVKTMGGFVGQPDTELANMSPITVSYDDPYAFVQMPKPYTGYHELSIGGAYTDGTLCIKHVDPTPFTLAAIYPRGESSARR